MNFKRILPVFSYLIILIWLIVESISPVSGQIEGGLLGDKGELTPAAIEVLAYRLGSGLDEDQKKILDRIIKEYEAKLTKINEEQKSLIAENSLLRKELAKTKAENEELKSQMNRMAENFFWGPDDLNPQLEKAVKKILRHRIKFIHDLGNPSYPLPENIIDSYVKWTYKWAKNLNIPVLYFAAVAETETNWVSKDSFDHGDSWTAFSMQIATIRDVLKNMGYSIPDEPYATNTRLRQAKRYRNFVKKYKSRLFDKNLDMKELAFEVAARHISWLMDKYDQDLARVALAYNTGSAFSKEIYFSYPMKVLGRYYYFTTLLRKEIIRHGYNYRERAVPKNSLEQGDTVTRNSEHLLETNRRLSYPLYGLTLIPKQYRTGLIKNNR